MVLMKITVFKTAFHTMLAPGFDVGSLLLWVLSTPVQFYCGARFYRGAYAGVRNRVLGMDFLVAMGTSAAYFYSVVWVLLGISSKKMNDGSHFFETGATLICFVLLGKYLEAMAKGRTSQALVSAYRLQAL
jgi:Cu+-exporting ATPase